jgi:hypothetical protein
VGRSAQSTALRVFGAAAAVAVLALAGLVVAVLFWSGATLAGDPLALARVEVQPLGGTLESARATGPNGRAIRVAISNGKLTPREQLVPGEEVTVSVVIRRPDWLAWALGSERHEQLTLTTPAAHVTNRWPAVAPGSPVSIRFDQPVVRAAYGPSGATRPAEAHGGLVSFAAHSATGTAVVAAAPRAWERLGEPVHVTWFPRAALPVALVSPAPGGELHPASPISLTFSKPVDDVLGTVEPVLTPGLPGKWTRTDSHTLVFRPSGVGAALGSRVSLKLPKPVTIDGKTAVQRLGWTVPQPSVLRLQQLLAEQGYLPVDWTPDGDPVARTAEGEWSAAVDPPAGHFGWRFDNTPTELTSQWSPGEYNQITRGAVMMFQHDHKLAVDAFAGPQVWQALVADAIAGKRRTDGYSYVYVHRNVPQLLTLWHNGNVVLTSPGNTGVPAAPTSLGTFPVFEHLSSGTMSGTNPDGSHYNDPGIKWISYFHGGEALHAFPRASFGTPQSLGCVELPLESAAKVWPYTPIGTLVTIEN